MRLLPRVLFRMSRRRRAVALGTAAMFGMVALLGAGCVAPDGSKIVYGTISGADGKLVDAMLGFDVRDGAGRTLSLGGNGYSAIVRVNHCVSAAGASRSTTCSSGKITGYAWALKVPPSATSVFIEVYPKAPTPTDYLVNYRGYTGVAAGTTDTRTYSTAYRRTLTVGPDGLSGVRIVLPKVCAAGGSTGSLVGHISGWPGGVVGKINAWSLAGQQPTMGFATGTVHSDGSYRIDGLQSGQRYGVSAGGGGFSRRVVDNRRATSDDTLVPRCGAKRFDF